MRRTGALSRLPSALAATLLIAPVMLTGCKKKGEDTTSGTGTTTAASASSSITASAAPASSAPASEQAAKAAPSCPPFDVAAMAPFATCGTNVVKSPVPEIIDPTHNLASFYDRLAELEKGTAKRLVRIGIYGDSNLTSDFLSAHLRRVLQLRYGDAGHGYISLARMWGSYRHEDAVQGGFWNMFKQWAPTTHVCPDKQYGFANMAAESSDIGAQAWAATSKDPKSKVGQSVSHFELHFLKQPRGGSFLVQIDKKDVRTIETKASAFEAGMEELDVEDGPHEIRASVKGDGKVRLFGVSMDRTLPLPKPGIQVDSLGAGALNYQRLTWVANDTRRVQLAKRNYDVIMIWLGTNVMFVPPNKEYAKEFITELRASIPNVPVLILGPGDAAHDGGEKSDPRIGQIIKQMKEVATETDSAFWDFREAMGGENSIFMFTKRGLTGEDHIHFGPEGSHLMGDRLLCSMTTSFSAHLAEHKDAGCVPSSGGAKAASPRDAGAGDAQ